MDRYETVRILTVDPRTGELELEVRTGPQDKHLEAVRRCESFVPVGGGPKVQAAVGLAADGVLVEIGTGDFTQVVFVPRALEASVLGTKSLPVVRPLAQVVVLRHRPDRSGEFYDPQDWPEPNL